MDKHALDRLLIALDVRVLAVALCSIGLGYRLRSEPADTIVLHYVLSGEGWIELDDGKPRPFGPNSILVVPKGCGKRIGPERGCGIDGTAAMHCTQGTDGLLKIDLTGGGPAMLRLACATVEAEAANRFGLFDTLAEPLIEDVSDVEAARTAFALLLAESAAPGLGSRALIAALVKQGLILALRRRVEREGADTALFAGLGDPRLARVAVAILADPGAPHGIGALAARAGMSRSVFVRKFSDTFGHSPMEFVASARLEAAARLLRSGPIQPVKTVASAVGFASRSHFSRAFRARYGVAPAAYRSASPDDTAVGG